MQDCIGIGIDLEKGNNDAMKSLFNRKTKAVTNKSWPIVVSQYTGYKESESMVPRMNSWNQHAKYLVNGNIMEI